MGQTVSREDRMPHNVGQRLRTSREMIVTVQVDRVMMDDILWFRLWQINSKRWDFRKVWDPDKAVLIYDHLVPASQVDDTRHFRIW